MNETHQDEYRPRRAIDGSPPPGSMARLASLGLILLLAAGCGDTPSAPNATGVNELADARNGAPPASDLAGPYEFAAPVFDIDAAPNGNILVAETVFPAVPTPGQSITTVKEIRRTGHGGIREIAEIATATGSPINGLETIGSRSFFAASGGLDLAVGAGVWHVTPGGARLVVDVEAFETANDPDATQGPAWKTPACEIPGGFSAGPQSNPYHLARLGGGSVLVADAAGNTVLSANTNGQVDWVALLTPPTPAGASSADPADWLVQFPLDAETDCYVQPVPTSVTVGPDGAYYVGELTGVTFTELTGGVSTGLSRVWRIEAGARNVVCPSADCEQVLSGFTSILDVEFGPDGQLYVVEYDENGWWGAIVVGNPAGGTINACDVGTGACNVVAGGLTLPGAISFDKWGDLWLLENNLAAPVVRRVDLP